MSKLLNKLDTISQPKVKTLPYLTTYSIKEFWDKIVLPTLPSREVILEWNILLNQYVDLINSILFLRCYHNEQPKKYDYLRRGFLSSVNNGEYQICYTDNFFALYFQKMAIDDFCPDLDDFYQTMMLYKFPLRFGLDTSNERAMSAIKKGKDPQVQKYGWKLAHIFGCKDNSYCLGSDSFKIMDIINKYYPKGEREDWLLINGLYVRNLMVPSNIKQFAIAHFLRFVNPFNYFLCPKKDNETNDVCKEIAENKELLSYAYLYNLKRFGEPYKHFLKRAMVDISYMPSLNDFSKIGDMKLTITTHTKSVAKAVIPIKNCKPNRSHYTYSNVPKTIVPKIQINSIMWAKEYLTNPNTSFRKIEQSAGIKSPARGGGFIAKKAINDLGITADKKGILNSRSIGVEITNATGKYLQTLLQIQKIYNL